MPEHAPTNLTPLLAVVTDSFPYLRYPSRDVESLWFDIAQNLMLDVQPGTKNYKQEVASWAKTFSGLRPTYFHVRRVYLRLVEALKSTCPNLLTCLRRPLSLTRIKSKMEDWKISWNRDDVSLTDDLLCWNLITSVDASPKAPFLFGMHPDTHMGIACSPTPLNAYGLSFKENSVFVATPFYRLCLADTKYLKRGNVWVETQDGTVFIVADNWIDFVENFVLGVELGNFVAVGNVISRWPQLRAVEQTTRDLKIRVTHMQHPCSEYLFMYHITLSMDENATQNKSKLKTRYWKIADSSGESEEVSGPGVVGCYPEIGPGDSFSYSSCCPLPTPTGTMEGYFTFEDKITGESWNCVVPRMNFKAEQTITPATIAAKDIQSS